MKQRQDATIPVSLKIKITFLEKSGIVNNEKK